ncbi:MAG: hypothetical protein D6772_10835 [Bacteroidetes bacterium]|nr:MAG: hypothetical protein D6772_10835 [Bacteroidota bacterium]
MFLRLFAALFLGMSLLVACEDDQSDDMANLLGRWEVITAYRDKAPTESLSGLYYDFAANGQLRTNMTGTDELYTYRLDDDKLEQRAGALDADYHIELLKSDTLILSTELRRKQFRIILRKAAAPTDSLPSVPK